MTLKTWEIGVGVLGGLFALLYLSSNVSEIGIALICADLVWLLTRVEIQNKPGPAGRYATLRGRLGLIKLVLLIGVEAAVIYGSFVIRWDHETKLRVGAIASFALAGLAFLLLGEIKRSGDEAVNWLIGARAERRVGADLDRLVERGWFVLHGYNREWGGDIDHFVSGRQGAYMIDTTSSTFRRSDLRRAAWNAAWLKEQLGVSWVTGVLCVNEERPTTLEGKIWVVDYHALLPWLEKQQNAPVDPELARKVLLS